MFKKTLSISLFFLFFASVAIANPIGYDVDKNGVWDDVQMLINKAFKPGTDENTATTQLAKSFQSSIWIMVYGADQKTLYNVSEQRAKALECFYYVHKMGAKNAANATMGVVITTEERFNLFMKAEEYLQNMAEPSEDYHEWPKSCERPVKVLINWPKD